MQRWDASDQNQEIEGVAEAMFQPLFDKVIEGIEKDVHDGELSSRIEIRVVQILEAKGVLSQVSTAELNRLKQIEHKA